MGCRLPSNAECIWGSSFRSCSGCQYETSIEKPGPGVRRCRLPSNIPCTKIGNRPGECPGPGGCDNLYLE